MVGDRCDGNFAGFGSNRTEDLNDLTFQAGEVRLKNSALGMENHIDRQVAEMGQRRAHDFAQTTLDAIAINSFTQRLGHGETHTWTGRHATHRGLRPRLSKRAEVRDLLCPLLAPALIHPLILRVLAQAMLCGRRHRETMESDRDVALCAELLLKAAGHGRLLVAGVLRRHALD